MSAFGQKVNLSQGKLGSYSSELTFGLNGPEFGTFNNGGKREVGLFFQGMSFYYYYFALTGTEVGRTFVPEPRSSFLLGLGLLGLAGTTWRARCAP